MVTALDTVSVTSICKLFICFCCQHSLMRSVPGHPPNTGDTNTPVWFRTIAEGRWFLRAGNHTLETRWGLCKAPCVTCLPPCRPPQTRWDAHGRRGTSGTFAPHTPVAPRQRSALTERCAPAVSSLWWYRQVWQLFLRQVCALEPASLQRIFTVVFSAHTHPPKKKIHKIFSSLILPLSQSKLLVHWAQKKSCMIR